MPERIVFSVLIDALLSRELRKDKRAEMKDTEIKCSIAKAFPFHNRNTLNKHISTSSILIQRHNSYE